jgi:hypothetical protein
MGVNKRKSLQKALIDLKLDIPTGTGRDRSILGVWLKWTTDLPALIQPKLMAWRKPVV